MENKNVASSTMGGKGTLTAARIFLALFIVAYVVIALLATVTIFHGHLYFGVNIAALVVVTLADILLIITLACDFKTLRALPVTKCKAEFIFISLALLPLIWVKPFNPSSEYIKDAGCVVIIACVSKLISAGGALLLHLRHDTAIHPDKKS